MAKVKIYLEEGETVEQAKEKIAKAFSPEEEGIHEHLDDEHRPFPDPVLQDIHKHMNAEFSEMYNQMFKEIEIIIKNPHLVDLMQD